MSLAVTIRWGDIRSVVMYVCAVDTYLGEYANCHDDHYIPGVYAPVFLDIINDKELLHLTSFLCYRSLSDYCDLH